MVETRRRASNGRGVLTSAVLAALTALPATAYADDPSGTQKRTVAIIDISPDAKPNREIAHEIYAGFLRHQAYVPKNIHAVLNAGGEVDQQNAVKTAQAFIKAGKTAAKRGENEDAAEQFESATGLLEKNFAFLDEPSQYRGALLRLGEALLKEGEKKQADRAFLRAAIVKADLGDAELGSDAQSVFESAKTKMRDLPLGGVQISSVPPNAEVYVDGRYKGVTPLTVAGLRKGKHFAALKKSGYARRTMEIIVEDEELGEETVELKPARKKLLFDQLTAKLETVVPELKKVRDDGGDGIKQAASLLFSEVAVVVNVTGTGTEKKVDLFIFDTATKFLLNKVTATLDWSFRNKRAARALVKDLTNFNYAKALGGNTDKVDVSEGGIETKWWFWTIIGAVVVGGVVGVTYWALTQEEPPPFTKDGTGAVVVTF